MFARAKTEQPALGDLEQLESLVRARYGVGEDQIVLITQEHSRQPGLPPVSTVILFWHDDGVRHRLRVFRPCSAVVAGDLPPGWLRGALRDEGESDCC